MDNTTTLSHGLSPLIIILIIIGFFLLLAFFINIFLMFSEERNYIKMEMSRSLDDEEYRYWKKELRLLYLRSIPIVGMFFR